MNIPEYLQGEIIRLKKKTQTAIITGVLLSTVVVIYSVLAVWIVGVFSSPESLASFALSKISHEAPAFFAATEANLAKQAPTVAENISKSLQQAIPTLRVRAQLVISSFINSRFDNTQKKMAEISEDFFAAHNKELPARLKSETVAAYGNRIANELADNFGEELNKSITQATGNDIYELNARSNYLLELTGKHFDNLAKTPFDKLSHDDQLERLLIENLVGKYFSSFKK